MEIKKIWLPESEMVKFNLYKNKVWRLTRNQNLKALKNFNDRGVNKYHLDHKISIFNGFINNIPYTIIGDISNLQMLPSTDNITKGVKCYSVISQNNHLIKEKYVFREKISFR